MFALYVFFSLIIFHGVLKEDSNPVFEKYNYLELKDDYEPDIGNNVGYIIIKLENERFLDTIILINGSKKYKFDDKLEVKLEVHNNDVIEIDGSMYNEKYKLKIVGVSKNIMNPKLDTVIVLNKGIEVVGTVILN